MTDILRHISNDELTGILERYPWFGAARLERCRRCPAGSGAVYAEAAPYAASLKVLYAIANGLEPAETQEPLESEGQQLHDTVAEAPVRRVRAAGGDFFSQDEYDNVRRDDDSLLSAIATAVHVEKSSAADEKAAVAFCTEPLAQIYAEQGYPAQAKYIYSQLILRYPEKSAYFAALIDELNKLESN